MRRGYEQGFTLVETLMATALLALVLFIVNDLLINAFLEKSNEDLSYYVNKVTQDTVAHLEEDIKRAGFRILPLGVMNESGSYLYAIETPQVNRLILRCITSVGTLQTQVDPGTKTLNLAGSGLEIANGINLVYAYDGRSGYLTVESVSVPDNTVTLVYGSSSLLPAGTIIAAVSTIEYQVDAVGANLIRRVNGIVQSSIPIDPAGTSFRFTLDNSAVGGPGAKLVKNILETDPDPAKADLARLLYVNVALKLSSTKAGIKGRTLNLSNAWTQQIAPMNLKTF